DHRIDKDHSEEPVKTDGDIRAAMKYITSKRQLFLEQSLINFIILDCQLLNILRNNAFRDMLHEFEPGFRIPIEEKCKKLINNSYE
ncbi:4348_t:CDS:1, partial [Funneliformis geosporum]